MSVTSDRTSRHIGFDPVFTAALWLSLILSAYFTVLAAVWSGYSWLAWVSLMPLFIAIWTLPPMRAAASGAIWGASFFFISIIIGDPAFSVSSWNLGLLVTVPAAYAFLGVAYTRRFGFSPLALALGWVCVELTLQPLGMRSGLLAAGQIHGTFPQLAVNLLGYGFVAFLVSFVNALLLWITGAVGCVRAGTRLHIKITESAAFIEPLEPFYISASCLRPSRPRAPPLSAGV